MDEQNIHDEDIFLEEEKEVYHPRPRYQIVAAWIGIGIMIVAFLGYCWQIAQIG